MKRMSIIVIGALAAIIFAPGWLSACPGCNALSDNSLGQGFNSSVLFMMSMPFVVFGSIAIGIVLVTRKSRNSEHFKDQSNLTKETKH